MHTFNARCFQEIAQMTYPNAEPVETYRGIEIKRTAGVLGFPVSVDQAFCFTTRYRAEDDAPILTMCRTVEQCRVEIDEELDDGKDYERAESSTFEGERT